MTKLNINTTDITRAQFAEDLALYAKSWVVDVQVEIFKMADEVFANPMLVNILHKWAEDKAKRDAEMAQLNADMAQYFVNGVEPYYGTDFDKQAETIDLLYAYNKAYAEILNDSIFRQASEAARANR